MKMRLFCVSVLIFGVGVFIETNAANDSRRWYADDNRQIINNYRNRLTTKYINHERSSPYSNRNWNKTEEPFLFINNEPGNTVKANQREIFKYRENPDKIYINHPSFRNISRNFGKNNFSGNSNPLYNSRSRYDRRLVIPKRPYQNIRKSPNEVEELRSQNRIYSRNICVRCPPESTSIAVKGKEYVLLREPKLQGCNSSYTPKDARFKIEYGPSFGSRLKEGKHVIVGKIIVNNVPMQECQLRHNVVVRRCPKLFLSPGVEAACPKNLAWGSACRFKCTDSELVMGLHGPIRIKCKDDLTWSAPPPTCKVPKKASDSWCEMPPSTPNSRLNCDTVEGYAPPDGMSQGTICQITCKNRRGSDNEAINTNLPHLICNRGIWHGDVPYCPRSRNKRQQIRRHRQNIKEMSNRYN